MTDKDHQGELVRTIAQITAAVTNTSLYTFSHPQVGQYVEKAYTALATLLAARPEVTLMLVGNDLVADNRPLPAASTYIENFTRILRKKSVERITFLSGMPTEELQALVQELAAAGAAPVRSQQFIKLGKVEIRVKQVQETTASPDTDAAADAARYGIAPDLMKELLAMTSAEMDELKEIYRQIKKHKQINVRGVEDVVKGFIKGFRKEINPLGILASLKSSHEYTFTHVTNVGILTMSQAERLGFSGEHLHQIGIASLLHDVGKLFIPEEIMNKPGMLTADERKIIETHAVKGARYLVGLEGIPKLAVLAALEHHIKFDGTGYPAIKTGWKPNLVSQIISVADVFDAMRSKRAYQESNSMDKIEGVLTRGKGTAFNPQLVDHFLTMVK